jgi:hypothetical protein
MVGGIGKGAIMVGAVNSPHPLPKTAVPAGCDHVVVTQKVSGRQFDATVTHLPGPSMEGVVTTESMAVAAQRGTKSYVFAAFLSDTVAVCVSSSDLAPPIGTDFGPHPFQLACLRRVVDLLVRRR